MLYQKLQSQGSKGEGEEVAQVEMGRTYKVGLCQAGPVSRRDTTCHFATWDVFEQIFQKHRALKESIMVEWRRNWSSGSSPTSCSSLVKLSPQGVKVPVLLGYMA